MTRPACVSAPVVISVAPSRGQTSVPAGNVLWQVGQLGTGGSTSLTSTAHDRAQARDSSSISTVPWSTRCRRISLPGPRSRAAMASQFPEARFYSLGGVPTAKIAAMLIAEAGLTLDPVALALEKEQMYYDSLAAGGGVRPIATVLDIARRHRSRRPAGDRVGQRAAAGHPHARGARHHRLVRGHGRRRGHRPPQARARRLPGGGPPHRRRRRPPAPSTRTPTSASRPPAAPA